MLPSRDALRDIEAGAVTRVFRGWRSVACPKDRFKRRVRSLEALGLTESLEVGYRLSPRGEALLRSTE